MPTGFLLGGVWHFESDPGYAIILAPLGGILVIFGIVNSVLSLKKIDDEMSCWFFPLSFEGEFEMKKISIHLLMIAALFVVLTCAIDANAQGGGKAEPNRIQFKRGTSSGTVTGKVWGDVQAEYAFGAKAGQTVTIKITSTPRGKFTAFNVIDSEAGTITEYDVNYSYIFTVPQDGDYLIRVFMRPTDKVRSAKFSLTLSIR